MKFSAYPWQHVRRLSRADAAIESAIAGWGLRVVAGGRGVAVDPDAASCELRIDGLSIDVRGPAALVRELAQRELGGPAELGAPRELDAVERAVWAMTVARAVPRGEVWPRVEAAPVDEDAYAVEIVVAGRAVVAYVPRAIATRVAPARAWPRWVDAWTIDAPVVLARCVVGREARLAARDLVTVERCCELEVLGGVVGLAIARGGVDARVASEYVRRDMAIAEDAEVELTVGLGTVRMTLRQVLELGVGQIVQLGRPLAGPFEVRAAGRLVGKGELVEVDGELAVRIVSVEE